MFEAFGASLGLTIGGCLFLVATSGAAVYFFMKRKKGNESDFLRQVQTILYEEILKVRELVTIRKPLHGDISFNDDRKIPKTKVHMPFSDRKLIMTYSGMIACGCDLDKIRMVQEGTGIKIIVPRSRILDCYADVKSFKVHYKDTGLLAKDFQIEEQNALIVADLDNKQLEAVQSGILTQADEEVRQMLTNIVERCGLNQSFDVEIFFKENDNARTLNLSQQNLLR